MNISAFNSVSACEEGSWKTIVDFDGIETDFKIKVIGIDSKKFKEQVNLLSRRAEAKKQQDIIQLEESSIRMLVSITRDWSGAEDEDGNEIPFSADAVEALYRNSPFVSEQIIEFAKERRNFIEKK